jgi:feruloyl esterase
MKTGWIQEWFGSAKRVEPASAALVMLFSGQVCAATCESLADVTLPNNSTITVAQTVSTGTFSNPDGTGNQSGLPTFCRVSGYAAPSSDSHIGWEVWLPVSGWDGRYQQVGNGGLNGSLYYTRLGDMVKRGYVVAATDGGHVGTGAFPNWDSSQIIGHPERIIDYTFRAHQVTHDNAMALIQAYYGKAPERAYFVGCSDGGREGLMMAKRFPSYFDGVVAGAPANYFTHLLINGVKMANLFGDPARAIPAAKVPAVEKASTAACQSVLPGLVEDPRQCHWDPGSLLCKDADNANCLTAAQVETVRDVMKGTFNPRTGRVIFPGYYLFSGVEGFIVPKPNEIAQQIHQFVPALGALAYQDTGHNFQKFDFDSDVDIVDNSLWGSNMLVFPEDLSAFKARGGKVLMYHGWEDPVISPYNSINFYERLIHVNANRADASLLDTAHPNLEYPFTPYGSDLTSIRSATPSSGKAVRDAYTRSLAATRQFARFYMIPGINHCLGGPGPQSWTDASRQYGELVEALENWVEKGTAPNRIVVSKHANDKPDGSVQYTHPLCLYPTVATYKGSGSPTNAENWICQSPGAK